MSKTIGLPLHKVLYGAWSKEPNSTTVSDSEDVSESDSSKDSICCQCSKQIKQFDPRWTLDRYGNYGSKYDMERVVLSFCDECMCKLIEQAGKMGIENIIRGEERFGETSK